VNKWFKKQHRTDTDARLDERNPNRYEPPPMDADIDNEGKPVTVAPATHRDRSNLGLGGNRPLKGGYWFIRERYKKEVAEAVAKDKEKSEKIRQEREEENRLLQVQAQSQQPSLRRASSHRISRQPPHREYNPPEGEEEQRTMEAYRRGGRPPHYSRYPPRR
jgi:hypothetical protein